jgi:hypothetical protein
MVALVFCIARLYLHGSVSLYQQQKFQYNTLGSDGRCLISRRPSRMQPLPQCRLPLQVQELRVGIFGGEDQLAAVEEVWLTVWFSFVALSSLITFSLSGLALGSLAKLTLTFRLMQARQPWLGRPG